jgi:hypothetical protein
MGMNMGEDTIGVILKQLGQVQFDDRDINLYAGYEAEVAKFTKDFHENYKSYDFAGLAHLSESQKHTALEPAHTEFFKASTSLDWAITSSGQGTFDNVFPETSSNRILMNTQTTPHWMMLLGFLEIGSASATYRIDPNRINGKPRGRLARWHQSRYGDLKTIRLGPAIRFEDRGDLDINVMFETAATVEFAPLCLHLLPFEVMRSDFQTLTLVTNSAP